VPAVVFEVLSPGARTTFQDGGRPGHAAAGIGRSGAADRGSHRLANRLVGNDEDAVVLEVVLGGLELRVLDTVRIALTGAPRPTRCDDRAVGFNVPLTLRPGTTLRMGFGVAQVYTYVAVSGGFVAERALGSSATDQLSGVGPRALAAVDLLTAGAAPREVRGVDLVPVAPPADPVELVVDAGPRADWFVDGALDELCREPYVVTASSTRVALRLDGRIIARARTDELPSEALVPGAIQVPPDGRPIVFGVDHPVTGGYPVLAVVRAADLDAAAQAHPGAQVRFRLGGRTAAPVDRRRRD
jgi:biotin-dependent carboxylase-like uncharacterized protein